MAAAIRVVLMADSESPTGRHFVQVDGAGYDNTPCGTIHLRDGAWVIKGDDRVQAIDGNAERRFASALAAGMACAAEYVAVNEKPDASPGAHKLHTGGTYAP